MTTRIIASGGRLYSGSDEVLVKLQHSTDCIHMTIAQARAFRDMLTRHIIFAEVAASMASETETPR